MLQQLQVLQQPSKADSTALSLWQSFSSFPIYTSFLLPRLLSPLSPPPPLLLLPPPLLPPPLLLFAPSLPPSLYCFTQMIAILTSTPWVQRCVLVWRSNWQMNSTSGSGLKHFFVFLSGLWWELCVFVTLDGRMDGPTDQWMDGQIQPLIEMRGRI